MEHESMSHGNHDKHDLGHSSHHAMMIEDFKKRFWVVLVLTIPIVILSDMVQMLL